MASYTPIRKNADGDIPSHQQNSIITSTYTMISEGLQTVIICPVIGRKSQTTTKREQDRDGNDIYI